MTARDKHRIETVASVGHNGSYRRLQLAPYAVAVYCLAVFFADGKANLALLAVACAVQQYEILVGNARGVLVHIGVLVVLFKSVDRLQDSNLLCGKLVATLVSASCKHSSATGGLHSCAEAVHFAALSLFGLVSSFHVVSPLFSGDFFSLQRECNAEFLLSCFRRAYAPIVITLIF